MAIALTLIALFLVIVFFRIDINAMKAREGIERIEKKLAELEKKGDK